MNNLDDKGDNLPNSTASEYISLYDLLKWVDDKYYKDLTNTTYELLALLNESGQSLPIYQHHKGIKDRIAKQDYSFNDCLLHINKNKGYYLDDLPF